MNPGHLVGRSGNGLLDLGIELVQLGTDRRRDVGQFGVEPATTTASATAATTAGGGGSRRRRVELEDEVLDVRALQRAPVEIDLLVLRQLTEDSVAHVAQEFGNRIAGAGRFGHGLILGVAVHLRVGKQRAEDARLGRGDPGDLARGLDALQDLIVEKERRRLERVFVEEPDRLLLALLAHRREPHAQLAAVLFLGVGAADDGRDVIELRSPLPDQASVQVAQVAVILGGLDRGGNEIRHFALDVLDAPTGGLDGVLIADGLGLVAGVGPGLARGGKAKPWLRVLSHKKIDFDLLLVSQIIKIVAAKATVCPVVHCF